MKDNTEIKDAKDDYSNCNIVTLVTHNDAMR